MLFRSFGLEFVYQETPVFVVIFTAALSFIVYILTLLVVILVPLYVMKHKTTLRLLGVDD